MTGDSTALYKSGTVDEGWSYRDATMAKVDTANLRTEIAKLEIKMEQQETRMIKWIVGSGLLYTSIVVAVISLLP